MTFDEAIRQINRKAGHRRDTAAAEDALNLAIESLEADTFLPWFTLSEKVRGNTTEGENRVPLPRRWLKGYTDGELFYREDVSGKTTKLIKDDYEDLVIAFEGNGEPNLPTHYALVGNYYRLFPEPDDTYTLFMLYHQKSMRAWDNPDNVNAWLENAARLTVAKAAIILMEDTRDVKGMAIQEKVFAEERTKLMVRNTELEEINSDREMSLN